MSWTHVNRADVNNVDIFAFVNLQKNVVIKGRVVVGSDLSTQVLVMDSEGGIQGMVELPDWAYYSTEEAVLRTFYEEVDKLPGADFKNKIWNVKNKNYTPEVYEKLIEELSKIAFAEPIAIVLKYTPDLHIDDSMFDAFKF